MARPITPARARYLRNLIDAIADMAVFYIEQADDPTMAPLSDVLYQRARQNFEIAAHYGRILIAGYGVHTADDPNCECGDCILAIGEAYAAGDRVH